MKKKAAVIAGIVAVLAIGIGIFVFAGRGSSGSSEAVVYVSPVEMIMDQGSLGVQQRFAGVVEPQETYEVQVQQDRTVKEVLVEKGQEVQVGTPLFTYDTEQTESDLNQANLDLERLQNEISNLNEQIATLQKEKKSASEEEKLNYTTQIQMAQNDLKKTEYEIKSKKIEIEKLKDNIENATVASEMAGTVKSISDGSGSETYYYGSESGNAFITILQTEEFRVKGTVNEQNIFSITEGAPVIIRSRVNDEIWTGTMGMVDLENGQIGNDSSMYYYGSSSSSENQSSNYPFYVTLDSSEGLMLGQHVYIELDVGQEEEKLGVWLPEYFICDIDSDPYVWADNGKGKLTKKHVILGQYDEDMMEYEIVEGLTMEDAITFPEDSLAEGLKTEITADGSMGNQAAMDMSEDMMLEDGMTEDMMWDEDMTEDMMLEDGMTEDMMLEDGTLDDEAAIGGADDSTDMIIDASGDAAERMEGTE